MNRLERISIQGFRRLRNIDIELRPLNVMIGANGVGKTTFLEAMMLLCASSSGLLQSKLLEFGGLDEIRSRTNTNQLTHYQQGEIGYDIQVLLDDELYLELVYKFALLGSGRSYQILNETLVYNDFGNETRQYVIKNDREATYYTDGMAVKPTWKYEEGETALAQAPRTIEIAEELRQYLASAAIFTPINVGSRSPIRLPQPMSPASMPGKNGEDLISFLYTLRENHPERFRTIEDTLSAAFPDFERLGFPPVAAGVLAMTWKDKSFDKAMYMNQLSEGTLRFLWLASLLQSPDLPAITMIDEPEVSLHPELLSLLAQLLREASERSQIFVATHSDRLVRFLKPSEVLVMDSEEGYAKMTWADAMDIERWLEDYSLDEIWQMGQIGGRA